MGQHTIEDKELQELGLDPSIVKAHQSKIRLQLKLQAGVTFPILECGGLGNKIVLCLDGDAFWSKQGQLGLQEQKLCIFVPAAGAASRYLKLFDAIDAARSEDKLHIALDELCALLPPDDFCFDVPPAKTKQLSELYGYAKKVWARYGQSPKGLMPATLEGLTFFELKLLEFLALNPKGTIAVVVAEAMASYFKKKLAESVSLPASIEQQIFFLTQDMSLSTIRLNAKAEPVRQKNGEISPVVGGHGELVRLFPALAQMTKTDSVFVINIDNVVGTSPQVQDCFHKFYGFYRYLFDLLKEIRKACEIQNLVPGLEIRIREFLERLGFEPDAQLSAISLLQYLQEKLFHSESDDSWQALGCLFARPLTVQGFVPNNGQDVGGIPALIQLDGKKVKISLEMPHASVEDQETYFKNPQLATHFNPGFVFHELQPHRPTAASTDPRFWMLTKKTYAGEDVYYHETVLYEAVGNSVTNNVVFIEIPRFLFRPHKVFTDCRGKTLVDYGFEGSKETREC